MSQFANPANFMGLVGHLILCRTQCSSSGVMAWALRITYLTLSRKMLSQFGAPLRHGSPVTIPHALRRATLVPASCSASWLLFTLVDLTAVLRRRKILPTSAPELNLPGQPCPPISACRSLRMLSLSRSAT